ncbi:Uncharacterised protein [uncultured Clostridium sp.]|nr:Uncharacterised protein [uncultured Clostridium sp.]
MRYQGLHDLLASSNCTRQYFLSLPVAVQVALHEQDAYIHTAAQLRARAEAIEQYNNAVRISRLLW